MKKRIIGKLILYIVLFIGVLLFSSFTKLPAYFDSYIYYEDYQLEAHLCLIAYRIVIYILFPLIVSAFEISKSKNKKFWNLLIENFNLQFCAYSILSGIYVIAGLDKILGVDLFGVSDIFVFVTGFVFTVMLKRQIPQMVYPNEEKDI